MSSIKTICCVQISQFKFISKTAEIQACENMINNIYIARIISHMYLVFLII